MKHHLTVVVLFLTVGLLLVPDASAQGRREIQFPDIAGFKTLLCDLHTHTVFSDGDVWPNVRVKEAWREGLDAIAISDHIEYLPHKDDMIINFNRPHEIATGDAQRTNLLLMKGAEITRDTPPGHFNALFLKNVAPLETDGFEDAVRIANEQGAFVFWNHPMWQGPERGKWRKIHTTLFKNGWLHGIEVVNGDSYYPEAHKWCMDKGLAMLGNTDIHAPSLIHKSTPAEHRTMTLVFAEDKSLVALNEALHAARTVVWHDDRLIGPEQWLDALFRASIQINKPHHQNKERCWVKITNNADIDIQLERTRKNAPGPENLTIYAAATTLLELPLSAFKEGKDRAILPYTVTNFLIAPEKGLPVELAVSR
jgi:hypothetical protein